MPLNQGLPLCPHLGSATDPKVKNPERLNRKQVRD